MSKKENINDDILYDEMIFKMAAEEKNKAVPESIDKKIKETIKKLPERKRRTYIKYAAVAACTALLVFITFSAAFPAMAENIPVVNSVFQFLNEKNLIGSEYLGYTSKVDISKTSNGTTVTINSIAYDGIDLSIGYTVQTSKKMKDEPHILDKIFKINGKRKSFGSSGSGYFINDKTYVGVDTFGTAQDYMPESVRKGILGGNVRIPDSFNLDLDINEFYGDIKGDWDFKFRVTSEMVKGKVKNIKTSVDLSKLQKELKVNELVLTPMNTALRICCQANIDLNRDGLDFIVIDNNNRVLKCKGSEGTGNSGWTYYQYLFKNIYPDTTSLTFIPVISKFRGNSNGDDGIKVPLNKDGVTVIPEGSFGEYKITKVEFLKDKTLFYWHNSGTIPYNCGLIVIKDNEGKQYIMNFFTAKEINEGENTYITELPALSKDKSYTVKADNIPKYTTLRDDLKFTINIK